MTPTVDSAFILITSAALTVIVAGLAVLIYALIGLARDVRKLRAITDRVAGDTYIIKRGPGSYPSPTAADQLIKQHQVTCSPSMLSPRDPENLAPYGPQNHPVG